MFDSLPPNCYNADMAYILIVDDEPNIATLIKLLMESSGHRVSTACNGMEALKLLGMEPARPDAEIPDLIILDVRMPVMDGCTVATRLTENARTRGIPLIILTAKRETSDIFHPAANVAARLDKPFDPKNLRNMVASILSRKP